jgi:transcriptional regulator with XRE-family HTH domain
MFMDNLMNIFRKNLKTEIKKIGTKIFLEKTNLSKSTLSLLMRKKRKFREDHLEIIEQALQKPIYQLFLSQEEMENINMRRGKMIEYQEMIELMEIMPAIHKIMTGKLEELKNNFSNQIASLKKKNFHI